MAINLILSKLQERKPTRLTTAYKHLPSKMAHVIRPTYILAPNWSFPEDGDIQLGNIVTDPFYPNYPLHSNLEHAESLKSVLSVENNWHDSVNTFRNVQANLRTRLFNVAKVDVHGYTREAGSVGIRMAGLDTYSLPKGQLMEKIRAWAVEMPSVSHALKRRNAVGRRLPVYVVSGIKVARDFRQYNIAASASGGGGGVNVSAVGVAGGGIASAGGSVQVDAQASHSLSSEAGNNIVFAYELVKVRLKGKGEDAVDVSPYSPKNALLSDEHDIGDGNAEENTIKVEDLETADVSDDDLVEFARDHEADLDLVQQSWLFPVE